MYSPEGRFIRYVEGSPEGIIERGTDIKELGDKMLNCASVLDGIRNNALDYGGQEGKAIDALRESIGDSYETLQLAGELYQPVGPIITAYGQDLERLQPLIKTTVDDCHDLWDAYISQPGDKNGNVVPEAGGGFLGMGGYDADSPEAQQEADENKAALDAYNAWEARAEDFDRHYDSWEQAFDDAEQGIGNEMAGSIEDSFWDKWGDIINVLTEILSWAALIVGVIALFCGGWVIALAAVLALGAFALTGVKYLNDQASGWDLAFAALAIFPVGKITNLTKLAQLPKLATGAGGLKNAAARTWKVLGKGPIDDLLRNATKPATRLPRHEVIENLVGKSRAAHKTTNISMYIGNRSILETSLPTLRAAAKADYFADFAGKMTGHYGKVATAINNTTGVDIGIPGKLGDIVGAAL